MLRSNKFLTCQSDAMSFECWIFFSFHLTSSHRSFSCKLLIASHCHRSLCHPISRLVSFFHLILCLLSLSRLFSADHFSCRLSFSHLFSSHLSLPQLFSDFHSSSQLFSALRSSCQLILCLLISSLLFSLLLSSPNISSADLRSCQLVPPHLSSSQRALKSSQLFSSPKPAPKTDLGARASDPYAFHRKGLTQRSVYTQQVFAPHRSFFTETGKLFHRDREAFARRKLLRRASFTQRSPHTEKHLQRKAFTHRSFCTQKPLHEEAFTHSKLLHTTSFYTEEPLHSFYAQQASTQRSPYTKKLFHREAFTHSKLLHRQAFTHRSFDTQQAFTQSSPHTEKHFHTSFCTQKLLHTASFDTEKLLHTQAFSHNGARNFSSNTGSRRQRRKKMLLKHFLKDIFDGKSPAPKCRKPADISLLQP